jgi:uncharacterized protein (TIGR02588 family)
VTKPKEIPLYEWVAAAIGAALLAGVLAILVRDAVDGDEPPRIVIRVERVARAGDQWRVEFVAENQGDAAAADVVVRLEGAGADVVLDYVPGRSRRRGGFFLHEDPGDRPPEVRAVGYVTP